MTLAPFLGSKTMSNLIHTLAPRAGEYSNRQLAIRSLNEMRIDKLHDPSKALLVIDHTFPAADEKVANLHALMRNFASKQGCMQWQSSRLMTDKE